MRTSLRNIRTFASTRRRHQQGIPSEGHIEASDYRFPYADEIFDFAVLYSVFTHMLPVEMDHYVAEISRVLKKNGRCFATFHLINAESRHLMESGKSSIRFRHNFGSYWLVTTKVPELSVAYDETYIRETNEKYGLFAEESIYYGGWCGRAALWPQVTELGDQDVVLTTKR